MTSTGDARHLADRAALTRSAADAGSSDAVAFEAAGDLALKLVSATCIVGRRHLQVVTPRVSQVFSADGTVASCFCRAAPTRWGSS